MEIAKTETSGTDPAQAASSTTASIGAPVRLRTLTYQDEVLEHWISDEELTRMSELRRDHVVEFFWAFFGTCVGSIGPFIEKLGKFSNNSQSIDVYDLISLIMFPLFFILTVIMAFFWRNSSSSNDDLITQIRNRAKITIN